MIDYRYKHIINKILCVLASQLKIEVRQILPFKWTDNWISLLSPSTCMIKNDCRNFYIVNLSLNIDTWFQVPLYFTPLSNPLPWQTRGFSINPPSKSWTFTIPPLQMFNGRSGSVKWNFGKLGKSNFDMNLWNDIVQCIFKKWCKNEHVLHTCIQL